MDRKGAIEGRAGGGAPQRHRGIVDGCKAMIATASRRVCVLLVVDDLGFGGAERQVVELANHMDPDGFDVHVCALSDHVPLSETLTDAKRRLHIVRKRNRLDLSVVVRLAHLLKALHADIVHGYLFSAEIASRLAGRIAGVKLVVGSERNANQGFTRSNLLAYQLTRRCVDVIVANSHAGAESNARIFGRPPSDYRVVHNGVDVERFRPRDSLEIRQQSGLSAACPVVGVFANLKPQKNHEMLFRAFRLVLNSFTETRLLVVGDQPVDDRGQLDAYRAHLARLVDDLGIRRQCVFLGHRDDVEYIYPACDLTVLPSLHEGTPNVLLESMACGIPVVATNVCDNERIVKNGEVGFLVAVGDERAMAQHIRSLLADAVLRQTMGRNARRWVIGEFSTNRLAEKMAVLYRQLLTNKL